MRKLFGDDFITQKYIRRYGQNWRVKSWANKLVHIQTEHGVWRKDAKGYTEAGAADAWVLMFDEAMHQIDHCGPEKLGKFLLVDSYQKPKHGWTCFFCGENFKTSGGARDHFGGDPLAIAGCQIKVGDERGLLMALREAEEQLEYYRNEDTFLHRKIAGLISEKNSAIIDAEEKGYITGLSEGANMVRSLQPEPIDFQQKIPLSDFEYKSPNYDSREWAYEQMKIDTVKPNLKSITVKIKMPFAYKWRAALASRIFLFGGWVAGVNVEILNDSDTE